MSFTFQAGTTVLVSNGAASRELLVSSCSVSQTLLEESRTVKTLHSQNNVVDTFSNSKSSATIEFDVYLTAEDSLLLEWVGSTRNSNRYTFSYIGSIPISYTVYIKANGTLYQVTNCVVTNAVFKFDAKAGPLSLSVTAQGSDFAPIASLPALVNTRQLYSNFIIGGLSVSGKSSGISGLTLELSKSVDWVKDKTLQKIYSGTMYTPGTPIVDDLAIGGTITTYKTNNVLPEYTKAFSADIMYSDKVRILLNPCVMLSRWDTSDVVHKVMQDFKLLPNVSSAYMEFL